jgi:hypothetical protein
MRGVPLPGPLGGGVEPWQRALSTGEGFVAQGPAGGEQVGVLAPGLGQRCAAADPEPGTVAFPGRGMGLLQGWGQGVELGLAVHGSLQEGVHALGVQPVVVAATSDEGFLHLM